jgi:hypothetical protein
MSHSRISSEKDAHTSSFNSKTGVPKSDNGVAFFIIFAAITALYFFITK